MWRAAVSIVCGAVVLSVACGRDPSGPVSLPAIAASAPTAATQPEVPLSVVPVSETPAPASESTATPSTPRTPGPSADRPSIAAPTPNVASSTPTPGPIEVSRGNLERREIAFTFDCGGHAGPTREILATLREANVSVTFFMIGDWVRAYPDLAREIAARHEFAHHSDKHPDYPTLSDEQIIADLEAGERAFIEVTGRTTRPLWRAPSGARDARVLAAAARAGWPVHVFWTQERNTRGELVTGDSGDWRDFTPEQVAANIERAADLGNGVITVSHCDSAQTRAVLGPALQAIQARGLRIVTVSELLR